MTEKQIQDLKDFRKKNQERFRNNDSTEDLKEAYDKWWDKNCKNHNGTYSESIYNGEVCHCGQTPSPIFEKAMRVSYF